MAEIVNLNRVRKQKARADKDQRASENKVRYGRSKAERERDHAAQELIRSRLEQHKRDDQPD